MAQDSSHWRSFWDIAVPEEGASAVVELYGAAAAEVTSHCATTALLDGRKDDYRFWIAVLARVRAAERRSTEVLLQ